MTVTNVPPENLVSRRVGSPLGALTLLASETALCGVYFEGHRPAPRAQATRSGANAVLDAAEAALAAYFADPSCTPRAPLDPRGTAFERAVWAELARIPRGQTRSYGELARTLGRPTSARAVGAAVAHNPLSIFVPCHRVVGTRGALTGFAGGLPRKAWLLAHEGAAFSPSRSAAPRQMPPTDASGSSPY